MATTLTTRQTLRDAILAVQLTNVANSPDLPPAIAAKSVQQDNGYDFRPIYAQYLAHRKTWLAMSPSQRHKRPFPSVTLHFRISAELLVGISHANGNNRDRVPPHVAVLANSIQRGFHTFLTDFASTLSGQTANGGQSSWACIAAWLPESFWEFAKLASEPRQIRLKDKDGKDYKDADENWAIKRDAKGQPVTEEVYVNPMPRPGDEKDTWQPVEDTATDQERAAMSDTELWAYYEGFIDRAFEDCPQSRYVRMTLGVPSDAVTLYDIVGRGRIGAEQLQLFGPTRSYIDSHPHKYLKGNYKVWSQILKAIHLNFKKLWTTDDHGWSIKDKKTAKEYNQPISDVRPIDNVEDESSAEAFTFGSNKGGGNSNAAHFPIWLLALAERLEQIKDATSKGSFQVNSGFDNLHQDALIKDIAVVIARLPSKFVKPFMAALKKGESPILLALDKRLTRKGVEWSRPSADYIQSRMMAAAYGMFELPAMPQVEIGGKIKHIDAHELLALRGYAWDTGDVDPVEGGYYDCLDDSGHRVDDTFAKQFDPKKSGSKGRQKKGK